MPRILILLLVFMLTIFLLRREKQAFATSWALWIPTIWLLIIASRPVTFWFNPSLEAGTNEDLLEGLLLDRIILATLESSALLILLRRKISWRSFFRDNIGVVLFLAFSGLSIVWSDFAFISLKRYIKVLGHPLMALVVISEEQPLASFSALVRRCAIIHIPLSIALIKYFPDLGRKFSPWGEVMATGVATGKNTLGTLLFFVGLYIVWEILTNRGASKSTIRGGWADKALLGMIIWLLMKAHSATATLCLLGGIIIVTILASKSLYAKPRRIEYLAVIAVCVFIVLEFAFDISGFIVSVSGRESTFMGRKALWSDLLSLVKHPLIGTGFESFWLGERVRSLWLKYWWQPNQAHNGYLETYLNLGSIGLIFLGGFLFSVYCNCRQLLVTRFEYGRLYTSFFLMVLIYNVTEAKFHGLSLIWFLVFLIGLKPIQSFNDVRVLKGTQERVAVGAVTRVLTEKRRACNTSSENQGKSKIPKRRW